MQTPEIFLASDQPVTCPRCGVRTAIIPSAEQIHACLAASCQFRFVVANDVAPNVRLTYLHRDSGNYKTFGEEVFRNPDHLSLDEVEHQLSKYFIDAEFFDPLVWGLKVLSGESSLWLGGAEWHELVGLEATYEQETMEKMTIGEFLYSLQTD